jgi:hypothetical protein
MAALTPSEAFGMRFIDRFIHMALGDLTPTGQLWARFAFLFTCTAALMSFGFGNQMHWVHGVALACLTWVVALAPDAAHNAWNSGRMKAAVAIGIFCTPLGVMEFTSHAGYAAGFRGKDIAEAKVSKVKLDSAFSASDENKTNVDMWRKTLANLQAERNSLIEASPWAPTVKADGLKAEIAELEKRIPAEIKGGRGGRKAGCGAECEKLKDQIIDGQKRLGAIERFNELADQIAKLNTQIDGAQKVLNTKREVAAKTEHKVSAIDFQGKFFAATAALVTGNGLVVSDVIAEAAEQGMATGLAFAFTAGPCMAWFIAGLYRRFGSDSAHVVSAPLAPMAPAGPGFIPTGTKTSTSTTNVTIAGDDGLSKALKEVINSYAARMPQKAA